MFTGIVEEIGVIERFCIVNGHAEVKISCNLVLEKTNIGDSIATSGVCLTVNKMGENYFESYIMSETLGKINLDDFKEKSSVNLERAMNLERRFGGHIVSGHIDGIGQIIDIKTEEEGAWYTIIAQESILKYIVYKGSIAIDGISLTVAYVDENKFKVSVIPHTLGETILKNKKVHSKVNLECDMVGKYIEKFISLEFNNKNKEKSNITLEFLSQNGF